MEAKEKVNKERKEKYIHIRERNMKREAIKEKIIALIIECKNQIEAEQIKTDSNLVDDFMFDSVNIIDLLCMLENEFDIEIGDEYLEQGQITTVENICNIIEGLIDGGLDDC